MVCKAFSSFVGDEPHLISNEKVLWVLVCIISYLVRQYRYRHGRNPSLVGADTFIPAQLKLDCATPVTSRRGLYT